MTDKQELIDKINTAFKYVKLDGGTGLLKACDLEHRGRLEAEFRDRIEETKDWREISAESANQCYGSLSFMDTKGTRFHLPVYMIHDIKGDMNYDVLGTIAMQILTPGVAENLTNEQRESVIEYINYMLKYDSFNDVYEEWCLPAIKKLQECIGGT
jgi:hypothetical protein